MTLSLWLLLPLRRDVATRVVQCYCSVCSACGCASEVGSSIPGALGKCYSVRSHSLKHCDKYIPKWGHFPYYLDKDTEILKLQLSQARKRSTKTNFWGIFRRGGGLPLEGVGVKEFGVSLATQEKQTFQWDILRKLPRYFGVVQNV